MWAQGRESFGGGFGGAGGGAGGGGGGGFMDKDSSFAGGQGGEKKGRTGKNIVPVTIKQIQDCPDDTMKIGEMEVSTVTVVGLVRNVETTTTRVSFMLDDHTGIIEAIQYIGTDGEVMDTTTILNEGTYGRVVGLLRSHNKGDAGRKYLVIHKAIPISDLNEMSAHLLEVIHVPIKLSKVKEAQSARINGADMDNNIGSSLFGNTFGDSNGLGRPSGGNFGGGGNGAMTGNGFTQNQNLVLNIIKSCHGETGIHKDQIVQNVKNKLTAKEVDTVIEFLSGEGHIFSTVDDDHYKVTDWIGILQDAFSFVEESQAVAASIGVNLPDSKSEYKLGAGTSHGDCFPSVEKNPEYIKNDEDEEGETGSENFDGALIKKNKRLNIIPMPAPPNITQPQPILLPSHHAPTSSKSENPDPIVMPSIPSPKEENVEVQILFKRCMKRQTEPNLFKPELFQPNMEHREKNLEPLLVMDPSNDSINKEYDPCSFLVSPISESPENIRWMYKYEGEKVWTPFYGYDSLLLEQRYQEIKDELKYPLGIRAESGTSLTNATTNQGQQPNLNSAAAGGTELSNYGTTIVTEFLQNSERRFSLVNRNIFSNSDNNTTVSGFGWSRKQQKVAATECINAGKKLFASWNAPQNPSTVGQEQINTSELQQETNSPGVTASDCENDSEDHFEKDISELKHIVIVRSGLYEANLNTWKCRSTFWPGDTCEITRGTWFNEATWEPIAMDHAEQLEQEHLEKFAEFPLTSSSFQLFHSLPDSPTRKTKAIAHRVTFPEYHIDWTSATDIHLYRKKSSSVFMKSVSQKLGFQWGERISRGYFNHAIECDKPPELGHIVFVVHGIGQKMDAGRIVRNCSTFRENINGIEKKYFSEEGSDDKIAAFFPIEWRSSLKLDGDVVESITPNKILGLRQLLNTTAMDIMYYTSPLYRKEIQSALRNALNRTYRNFNKRNPDFEKNGGKFSILAHSLGAVITYDIVTSPFLEEIDDFHEGRIEEHAGSRIRTDQVNEDFVVIYEGDKNAAKPIDKLNKLEFQLEHFFCLGSPLSVFLALRWKEPYNPILRPYILPDRLCKRMYNIFNMNDPVAYRLEPLLNRSYIDILPMEIVNHNAPSQIKYDEFVREITNKRIIPLEFRDEYEIYIAKYQAEHGINVESPTLNKSNNFAASVWTPPVVFDSYSSTCSVAVVAESSSSFGSDTQGIRSPPLPSATQGPLSSGLADSFFGAIYNYWNKQPPLNYLPDQEPNEMEIAAAKLDSINFNLNSLEELESNSSRRDSLSMNVGSLQHYSSTETEGGTISSDESNAVPSSSATSTTGNESRPGPPPEKPVAHDFDYRLDYILRESNLPIPTGYLAALTSHTSYWSSPDIGFFVLCHLYNRIPCDAIKDPAVAGNNGSTTSATASSTNINASSNSSNKVNLGNASATGGISSP